MKSRSKTSRKPLKKKQNGKRTTKKNTKKHKQTHQARSKKSRGMIGGVAKNLNKEIGFAKENALFAQTSDIEKKAKKITGYTEEERAEEEDAQIRAEELHRGPPGALKAYVSLVVVGGGVIGLIALFGITRN